MSKVVGYIHNASIANSTITPGSYKVLVVWTSDAFPVTEFVQQRQFFLEFTFAETLSVTDIIERARVGIKAQFEAEFFPTVLGSQDLVMMFGAQSGLVQVSVDFTLSSTSFVTLDSLFLPVEPNGTYTLEARIMYKNTATGSGLALGMLGPAASSAFAIQTAIPGAVGIVNEHITGYDTGSGAAQTPAPPTNSYIAVLIGNYVNGPNAGVLNLRCKKTASFGVITILKGSVLEWKKVQ